jgi:glycerol kinase
MGPQERRADRPAIVWQDRRTADTCDALRADGKARKITASPASSWTPIFPPPSSMAARPCAGCARAGAARRAGFGTIDSWLVYKLTGQHVTDVSNASRTMLFNIHLMRWDPALLHLFDIPEEMLPQVVSSSEEVGNAGRNCSARPIPWPASPATSRPPPSARLATPGMVKNTYGTGCFMLMHLGRAAGRLAQPAADHGRLAHRRRHRLSARRQRLHGRRHRAMAARRPGHHRRSSDVEALAASVPDSGGVMHGAGLCRPRRAALGPVCARH